MPRSKKSDTAARTQANSSTTTLPPAPSPAVLQATYVQPPFWVEPDAQFPQSSPPSPPDSDSSNETPLLDTESDSASSWLMSSRDKVDSNGPANKLPFKPSLCWWLIGLFNNLSFVIMAASAKSIFPDDVAVLYLANSFPALCVRLSAP
jgi:hypothetical protein